MELKIDSKRVLEVVDLCPEWKKGLEKLFPEVFEQAEFGKPLTVPTDWTVEFYDSNHWEEIAVLLKGTRIVWFVRKKNKGTRFELQRNPILSGSITEELIEPDTTDARKIKIKG